MADPFNVMPTEYVPLPEHQPYETAIHIADGTFVKSYKVPLAGTMLPQHSHGYSHTSYVATGAVKVWKGGEFLRVVTAPDGILIEAFALHMFQTLEDKTTILCIHSVPLGGDPEIEAEHHVEVAGGPRERLPMEGITFQEESVDQWYADAVHLFRQHMVATGQDADDWSRKNLPLGRQLDAVGAIQIITARSSNGMMQGYLVSITGPSLDDPGACVAQNLPIFAAPECPGLGMKLLRVSIDELRGKGVTEIIGRAGVRGSGPRLGTLYRRLGFKDAGHLYRLEL